MGLGIMNSCGTNPTNPEAKAPNPNPGSWKLLQLGLVANGYVLKVKYEGCTNFEGVKIMVFKGLYKPVKYLDPHFANNSSAPVARFKPTKEGWQQAMDFAATL
jgi:hypothetical protein